ncbi:MAG: dUTP diphosphatase [Melioribacteraceae bacterium]|nr:dUTP diphosphatase [Melioribacteraceae bacterium]MCF8412001.1 dUTP diphosphatase [Melioribacteraceae bacterium]
MKKVQIQIKRIDQNFNDIEIPFYASEGSSGMDIRAAINSEYILKSGSIGLIPTNLMMEIPLGYEIQVRPRSGLAIKHGIGVLNSPGTIDSDYRGEVKIILFNFGKEDFVINRGDRIAQIVICEVIHANIQLTEDLSETKRGAGGFGHTGKQ